MDWFSKHQSSKLQNIHIQREFIPKIKSWFGPNKLSQRYFLILLRIMRQVRQKIPKWWKHSDLLAEYVWVQSLGVLFKNARDNQYCIQKEYKAIESSGRRLVIYYEKWIELLRIDIPRTKSFRKSIRNILKLALKMISIYATTSNDDECCKFHGYSDHQIEILRDRSDDDLIVEKQMVSYKRLLVKTIRKPDYKLKGKA